MQRLRAIRATLQQSDFFQTHEVIGSSLLFVHDRTQASIWLIDFAKTIQLPENTDITHSNKWSVGNHEDGYLIGINNLISIFEEILNESPSKSLTPSSSDEKISGQSSAASSRSHSVDDTIASDSIESSTEASTSTTATMVDSSSISVTPASQTRSEWINWSVLESPVRSMRWHEYYSQRLAIVFYLNDFHFCMEIFVSNSMTAARQWNFPKVNWMNKNLDSTIHCRQELIEYFINTEYILNDFVLRCFAYYLHMKSWFGVKQGRKQKKEK